MYRGLTDIALILSLGFATNAHGRQDANLGGVGTPSGNETPSQPSAAPEDAFPLTVPVVFKGRYLGDVAAEVTMSGKAYVSPADLAALLERIVQTETIERLIALGDERLPLLAIGSETVAFAFDPAELRISVQLASDQLNETVIRLRGAELPDPMRYAEPEKLAALIELNASQRYVHADGTGGSGFDGAAVVMNGVVSVGGFDGVSLTAGGDILPGVDGVFVRDVALVKDFYSSATRIRVGELVTQTEGFQSAPRLLGASVSRRYQDIQPFRNIRPTGRRNFVLERPSTVEVIVNGLSVRTLQLPEGPVTLDDLPLAQGANDVQIVIEDTAGERSVVNYSTTLQPILLSQGLSEFALAIGRPTRGNFSTEGGLQATGFYYRGFDNFTLGASAEVSSEIVQSGALVSIGGGWGAVSLQTAASRTFGGGEGWAAALDYAGRFEVNNTDLITINASLEATSRSFATLSNPFAFNGQAAVAALNISYQRKSSTNFTVGAFGTSGRGDQPDTLRLNAGVQHRSGPWNFGFQLSQRLRSDIAAETSLFFRVIRRIGSTSNASVRYEPTSGRVEFEAARFAQRELGAVSGRLQYGFDSEDSDLRGNVDYFGNRALLGIRHDRTVRSLPERLRNEFTQVNINTAIGVADGRIAFGRGGARGGFTTFARHSTLSDTPIDISEGNRRLAKIDGLGPVLVPLERPYAIGRRSVEVVDLPMGYDIGSPELEVFPGFFDGYSTVIGSDASRTVLGTLFRSDGSPVSLKVGELRSKDRSIQFFTNAGGRFAGERVSSGRYDIILNEEIVGELTISEDDEGLVDVGTIETTLR